MGISDKALRALDEPVEISDEQVAFYEEHGWIKVEEVLPHEVALNLRDQFLELSEVTRPPVKEGTTGANTNDAISAPSFRKQHLIHRELLDRSPAFRQAILSLRHGSVASRLLRADEVQMYRTSVFEKLPESDGGGETNLHQDFAYASYDRTRAVSIWIALDDLTPDMGTLTFVPGSHRLGSLGRDEVYRPDQDYVRVRADQDGWEVTPPLAMKAGDATVHGDLTVHGAGANLSSRSRIAVTSMIFDARSLYTGAPSPHTDGLGLQVNQPFPEEHFFKYPVAPLPARV